MTVRTWFTISAIMLAALTVAAFVWFMRPPRPPELLASVPGVRLEGAAIGFCWPQRGGELRCEESEPPDTADPPPVVDGEGEIRVVAAFPVQPEAGATRILDARTGREAFAHEGWQDRVPYKLGRGDWLLEAEARYPDGAFVRYAFPFRVG